MTRPQTVSLQPVFSERSLKVVEFDLLFLHEIPQQSQRNFLKKGPDLEAAGLYTCTRAIKTGANRPQSNVKKQERSVLRPSL